MPTLLRAVTDGDVIHVRRQGRMTVERAVAAHPQRFEKAVREAQEEFIRGMKLKGFVYVDRGFELTGPFPHIGFGEDSSVDPGPTMRFDPRDLDKLRAYEDAERARVARKVEHDAQYVDYVLIAEFETVRPRYLTVLGGSPVWTPQ